MAKKKVYATPVEDYTGKKRTNYSYNDVVQVDVPKWHQVLNKVQNWLGSTKKPIDPYNHPGVILNAREKK